MDIKVMTFNIRNGEADDGEDHWRHRKQFTSDVIRQYAPDVLGVQEAFRFQLDEFNTRLPEYGEIGCGRDGGTQGEYSAILYLKKRFKVDASGTFWLSDTPAEPSAHWGNHCLRICTWARLTDRTSQRSFYFYNTHLDHESQPAREKSVRLMVKHMQERVHQDPFVLAGDFNAAEDNPLIGYLKNSATFTDPCPTPFVDSFRRLHPDEKTAGTFNGFKGHSAGAKIDYIMVAPDTRTLGAGIMRTEREGRYPSDHYSVTAELRFE